MKKTRRILELTIFSALLMGVSGCGFIMNNNTSSSSENSSESESSSSTSQIDPSAVVAGGVIAETHSNVPNAYYFHSIPYYSYEDEEGYRYVTNTYKEDGDNYHEYNVNGGKDFLVSKQKNNFDLYVPRSLSKDANNTVVLFIHGGAWISGLKTDVNPYVHEFANRGYISATLKYTLLNADMNDDSLSIFRDLDEIDACINEIKECLEELEFDTNKVNIAIGGASSGAHLTMLYTYSRGERCQLPIKFIVNAVGPVDIKSEGWKAFVNPSDEALDDGLSYAAIEDQKTAGNLRTLEIAGQKDEEKNQLYWNEYQTLRISNGMCGLPYSLDTVKEASSNKQDITDPSNEAYVSMSKTNGGQDLLSVTYWINKSSNPSKYPMVCAYGGKDAVVGIAQYARLEKAMDDNGVDHDYVYFRNANHTDISKEFDETHYNQFVGAISDRLAE